VFAKYLGQVGASHLREIRLGRTAEQLLEQRAALQTQLDRYSYRFEVEFSDAEVDQARAIGVLIEFETDPIIVERKLFRRLCRDALKRTIGEFEQQLERRHADRKADRDARRQLPGGRRRPRWHGGGAR
jgi:hypothetical protein